MLTVYPRTQSEDQPCSPSSSRFVIPALLPYHHGIFSGLRFRRPFAYFSRSHIDAFPPRPAVQSVSPLLSRDLQALRQCDRSTRFSGCFCTALLLTAPCMFSSWARWPRSHSRKGESTGWPKSGADACLVLERWCWPWVYWAALLANFLRCSKKVRFQSTMMPNVSWLTSSLYSLFQLACWCTWGFACS